VTAGARGAAPTAAEAKTELWAAVVQLSSQSDRAENLATAVKWLGAAAERGAELVVLPENFAFMGDESGKCAIAESLDPPGGPIFAALSEAALRHRVAIVAGGMPERSADPTRPYNTSILVDRDGALAARYRKMHLFDVSLADGTELRESAATQPGELSSASVVRAAGVQLGMTICYDLRFPELYRLLEQRGAQLVTVPAAFTLTTGKDHWHVLLAARAIENQLFVLAAAQTGRHPRGRQTYGKSLIVDPWGDTLAQCGEGEGFALARLDFAYQARVRAALPCLQHRRM
jgi:predicted amidohydrolase